MAGEVDPRELKLPKWARDELRQLRSAVDSLRQAVEVDEADSNTFVLHGMPVLGKEIPDIPLGKSPRISFRVGKTRREGMTICIQDRRIRVESNGVLLIRPSASNSCWISTEDLE